MKRPAAVIAILLVAFFARGFLKGWFAPPTSAAQLQKVAEEINGGLPLRIDPDTELVLAQGDDHLLTFHYKFTTVRVVDVDAKKLVAEVRPNVIAKTCGDSKMRKKLLDEGTTVRHAFRDRDDFPLASVDVNVADCNPREENH